MSRTGSVVRIHIKTPRNRRLFVLSLLFLGLGIALSIFGSNSGVGTVVAGGVGLIIIGLILSKHSARAVLHYLDRNGFL